MTAVATCTGSLETELGARYMRMLCKHFAHKVEATYDEEIGKVNFPWGYCNFDARQPGLLLLEAGATDDDSLKRIQSVVDVHLERFTKANPITIVWTAALPETPLAVETN